MSLLERQLRLLPGEGRLVVVFGALTFANALAMQISYVASVSGFLKSDGLGLVWLMWLVNYAGFLAFAAVQTLFIDRFERGALMRGLLAYFTAAFLAIWIGKQIALPGQITYGALYLIAEQQWMLFPVIFWVFANDVVSASQAKRLFPLMAALGVIGKITGLGVATAAPSVLGAYDVDAAHLLLVILVLYLAALTLPGRVRRRAPQGSVPARMHGERFSEALSGGVRFVRDVASFRYLTYALLAVVVVDTLVEYHFLAATDAAFASQAAYQTFYGTYRIVLVLLLFGAQVIVARRVLERAPLQRALSFQPFVAFAVVAALIALPGVVTAVLALFVLRLVSQSLHEPATRSFQALVPTERRGRVTLILESVVISIGTIIGALVLGVLTIGSADGTRFDPAPVYLSVALVLAAVATYAAKRVRDTYESSLLNWRLRRRARAGASVLDELL